MPHVEGAWFVTGNSLWSVWGSRRKWWELGHQELDDKVDRGYGEEFRLHPVEFPPVSVHCTDTRNGGWPDLRHTPEEFPQNFTASTQLNENFFTSSQENPWQFKWMNVTFCGHNLNYLKILSNWQTSGLGPLSISNLLRRHFMADCGTTVWDWESQHLIVGLQAMNFESGLGQVGFAWFEYLDRLRERWGCLKASRAEIPVKRATELSEWKTVRAWPRQMEKGQNEKQSIFVYLCDLLLGIQPGM